MSNILEIQPFHNLTADVSKYDESFLKKFLRDFYQKIIDTKEFNTFEDTLTEWIKNIDKKDGKSIFELMKTMSELNFGFQVLLDFSINLVWIAMLTKVRRWNCTY